MKKKISIIAAALALCLSLLPGTALALDETTGVTVAYQNNSVPLADGKFYVAAEGNNGITEQDAAPTDVPYLAYNTGTLTVHGAFEVNAVVTFNSGLTITGDENSSLSITSSFGPPIQLNNHTLALSGGVDFTANSIGAPVIYASSGKFETTEDYSGDIALGRAVNTPAVSDTTLNVQNSGSIAITGMISASGKPVVLQSTGNVSITSNSPLGPTVTIKGANVKLTGSPGRSVFSGESLNIEAAGDVLITNENGAEPAIVGSAEISAGGDVTISGGSLPIVPFGETASLTISGAQNVSITGASSASNPFFYVPVTFTDCNSVTVTDNGDGDILKEGVTVTSNCPWTAKKSGGDSVTMPSGNWTYGGDITSIGAFGQYKISSDVPIVYKAGEGKIFYEPAAAEGGTAVLTLDGASFDEGTVFIPVSSSSDSIKPLRLELKGDNRIKKIQAMAHLTLTGTGSFEGELLSGGFTNNSTGTLNAVVGVTLESDSRYGYTVYGECSTSGSAFNVSTSLPLTIAEGATLTVDAGDEFIINDLVGLTNNGTIINNSTIKMYMEEDTEDAAISAFIKGLKLTGSGTVEVKKGNDPDTPTYTYTNSGMKLLTPAGTLDLSSAEATDANWTTQGYKWEVEKGQDDSGNEIITSAKLTLATGFNATSVKLPDTAVTIETEGESRIGTLTFQNDSSKFVDLIFDGAGPLTVQEQINIASGDHNTLTVNKDANVIANGGIYIGETGGVNSLITVDGMLKAAGYHDNFFDSDVPAVSAGKVAVGNDGVLEVSGAAGVLLNGMPKLDGSAYKNLFTVTGNGRFTANCSEYNVQVGSSGSFPEGTTAEGAINLSDEYMPDDCKAELKDGKINLVRISTGEVYSGALTIHKNHTWETRWTWDGTTHWHPCEFAGCTEKKPGSEAAHYYAHGSTACRDCNYPRPAGTPDSDSGSSGGSSGSGSSGGGVSSYTVTVEKASHGEVTADRRAASQGDTVTLTVSPDEGYETGTLTVTDRSGKALDVTDKGGGTYTFIMPGASVSVRAVFNKITAGYEACARDSSCPIWPFTDADANAWYHDGVHYCLDNGLMSGYGDNLFGPSDPISRAQFAQILHNREGRPAVNYLMQFVDVSGKEWYAEAVRWAASEGVVSGYGNGMFGPDDNITREQLALMLWRYAGSPAAAGGTLEFTDADAVSEYALEALCWAVENGIVTGRDGGVLDPQGQATRAEAAAMLMRYLDK